MHEKTNSKDRSQFKKGERPLKKLDKFAVKKDIIQSKNRVSVHGSKTVFENMKKKIPWILGNKLRKPKLYFPKIRRKKNYSMIFPPKNLGLIIIYFFLFLLQAGIVYLLYNFYDENLVALGAYSTGEALWIYPDVNHSFIIEAIVASILMFCTSMGFFLFYHASKHIYNRSLARRLLILGAFLTLISFILLQYMITMKVQPEIFR